MDAIKTTSKRAIQKTAEATGDLIDNQTAHKITNASKKSLVGLQNDDANNETNRSTKKQIHISRRKATNY